MQIRCNHTLNIDISNKVKMTGEWVGGKAKAPTPCGRDKSMYLLQKNKARKLDQHLHIEFGRDESLYWKVNRNLKEANLKSKTFLLVSLRENK